MDHARRRLVGAQLNRIMAAPAPTYRRLTRNSAGVGTYSSLWLADDHVMVVRSSGYHESYARLQFSDMKGIFLTKTNRRMWWGIFWGILVAWSGIVLITALIGRTTPMFGVVLFAISAPSFIWNHLLGEGCRAFVMTGVQTAELPSLVRMKKGRQVVARLQPLILQAQADLLRPPPVPESGAELRLFGVPPESVASAPAMDGAEAAPLQPENPPQPPAAG